MDETEGNVQITYRSINQNKHTYNNNFISTDKWLSYMIKCEIKQHLYKTWNINGLLKWLNDWTTM